MALHIRHAKKQEDNLKPKLSAIGIDENFIPFVGHFDPYTILTKNGELIQTIKITGFKHEAIGSEFVNLREAIRDAISKNIKTSNFALWLQTIRRRQNINPSGQYNDYLSKKLNDDWSKNNNWDNQFVNEFYLTVIIQGYDTSIINALTLLRSISFSSTKKLHFDSLEQSHQNLSEVVKNMVEDLSGYGAELIGIKEIDGALYSDPVQFFSKIISLDETLFPLNANDIATDLSDHKIAFGNQSLEVITGEKKRFATMLSIKEYREVSIAALDKFLQLPQEVIITQSIDFIDPSKALAHFEYQNYILEVSGDEEFRYLSDIEKTMDSEINGETDFAEQQITIMLINETVKGLGGDIESGLEKLYDLGLVTVREDIFSEHCFWSQLPGNFQFLKRQKPIIVSRVAGFASLHNFPAGNKSGNHWGDAVSIFRTVLGTPYFFNFHNGKNGHTLIAGPYGSGKTVLLNFLICQSRKFQNKLYYFGYKYSDHIFVNALKGNYLSIGDDAKSSTLKLNPLKLENNPENRAFLCNWFSYLVHYGKESISAEELKLIPKVVDKIINSGIKKLSEAANIFKIKATQNIYHKLSIWHSGGKYSHIFDNEDDASLEDNLINSFNLTSIVGHQALVIPVFSYIMHKIENDLNGENTMIVLDEAWKFIDNYAFGPKINNWLERMKQKNCMVIFATESLKDAAGSNITEAINHNIATQIFLPDPNPSEYYQTVFGLNDNEFHLLSAMSGEDRHFMLKYDGDAVVAALNLSNMPDAMNVLSSNPKTLVAMHKAMSEKGDEPENWLPRFFELAKMKTVIGKR